MIKPLPTKNGKLPSVADLMSGIKALALPVSVAVVLTTPPPKCLDKVLLQNNSLRSGITA